MTVTNCVTWLKMDLGYHLNCRLWLSMKVRRLCRVTLRQPMTVTSVLWIHLRHVAAKLVGKLLAVQLESLHTPGHRDDATYCAQRIAGG
jgi:hypothetical protein